MDYVAEVHGPRSGESFLKYKKLHLVCVVETQRLNAVGVVQNYMSLACFGFAVLRVNTGDDTADWETTVDFSGFLEAVCRLSDCLKHPYILPALSTQGPVSRSVEGECLVFDVR